MAVEECKAGVKRLIKEDSIRPNGLVLVSDWSRQGTGYIVYQVLCDHVKPNQKLEKINCCRELWRIINCGGTFNTPSESCFAPIEGELLGITKALHKARYYIMGHSNLHLLKSGALNTADPLSRGEIPDTETLHPARVSKSIKMSGILIF